MIELDQNWFQNPLLKFVCIIADTHLSKIMSHLNCNLSSLLLAKLRIVTHRRPSGAPLPPLAYLCTMAIGQ